MFAKRSNSYVTVPLLLAMLAAARLTNAADSYLDVIPSTALAWAR